LSGPDSQYRSFIELDMGTMSLPKLARKLGAYAAYAGSASWKQGHSYMPILFVITTTARRAESVIRTLETKCRWEEKRLDPYSDERTFDDFIFAACAGARSPEAVFMDPLWTTKAMNDGLSFMDLATQAWEKAAGRAAAARAETERRAAERELMRNDPEGRRLQIHQTHNALYSHLSTLDYRRIPREKGELLRRLLEGTEPMGAVERRAWRFFERRVDPQHEPHARHLELSADEEEALEDLRSFYLERQRQKIAEIFERYAHLPVAERSMPRLEAAELLSWIDEARLEETVRRDVAKLKEERSGLAAYVTWRAREVKNRKGGLGMVGRLIGNSDQLAIQIDEELLQYCSACRHIALPHGQFSLYATRSICNFCDKSDLESLKEARRAGEVASDGNGFWQVRYPPSPAWTGSPEL